MAATAKQAVYTRINSANITSFNESNTVMSAPTVLNNPEVSPKNTTVRVTGIPPLMKGSLPFYYNRRAFTATTGSAPVELVWGAELRIHDLIPQLNEKFGINLVEDDLVDAGLPDRSQLFTSFSITASYDSYGWMGSFVVNLQVAPVDIEDEVEDQELDNPDLGGEPN